jgi:hypothetical protein
LPEFSGDYKAYIKARKELPRDKKTSSYSLWKKLHEDSIAVALSPLAMKALEFPLPSIAAERAFAITRKIDVTIARRSDVGDVLTYKFASTKRLCWTRSSARLSPTKP